MKPFLPRTSLFTVCALISHTAITHEIQPDPCNILATTEAINFVSDLPPAIVTFNLAKTSYESWIITRNAESNQLQYVGAYGKKYKIKPQVTLPVGSRFLFGIQRGLGDKKHCLYFNVTNAGSVTAAFSGFGPNSWKLALSETGVIVEDEASRLILDNGCCPYP